MNFTSIFDQAAPQGYQQGLSFAQYQMEPGVNQSLLKSQTALEMWHGLQIPNAARQEELTESRAYSFALGEAVHKAILEPNKFETYFQFAPRASLVCDASLRALRADPSRPLVTPAIIDIASRCRDAAFKHHLAAKLLGLKGALREVSGFAWDPAHNLRRKWRLDFLPAIGSNFILDIKTTSHGLSKGAASKEVRKLNYDLQAAYYLDAHAMLTGEQRTAFVYLFVSTDPPHMARLFRLCETTEQEGRAMPHPVMQAARDRYQHRLAMFAGAAGEFQRRALENHPDPLGAWEAYENEEEIPEICYRQAQ